MSRLEDIALKLMECRQAGLSDEATAERMKLPLETVRSYEAGIRKAVQCVRYGNRASSDAGFSLGALFTLATVYKPVVTPHQKSLSRTEKTIERIKEAQAEGYLTYAAIAERLNMNYGYIRQTMIKAGLKITLLKKGGGAQLKNMYGPPITEFHRRRVYELREQGKKYVEIGAELAICPSWACQLYQQEKAKRKLL
jgi:DNA-binding CsgD family transcriptional regulator